MTRDELVADLLSRLSRARSSEDARTAVADPVVAYGLAELGQMTTSDDVEAAYVLAAVHSARYVLGPHGDGELDWVEALRWCAQVLPVAAQQAFDLLGPLLVDVGPTDHEDRELSRSTERRAAIGRLVRAAAAIPMDNPSRTSSLSNLGLVLHTRYERTGAFEDIDEAVAACREAVAAPPAAGADRAGLLSNLGLVLHAQFERTGSRVNLDEAVSIHRQALAVADGDNGWPTYASNLGIALQSQYEQTGVLADLDEAVDLGRRSVAVPVGHVSRAAYLSNLGVALHLRYSRVGALSDLDEAVDMHRQAVAAIPSDHTQEPTHLSNLASALQDRYERTGTLSDLDEAVDVSRRAVAAVADDQPSAAMYLSNLASALRVRFRGGGEQADLDEAVHFGRLAVSAIPVGHPDRSLYLSNCAAALQLRAEHSASVADANEAVAMGHLAVSVTPAEHPDRAMYQFILGSALHAQGEFRNDTSIRAKALGAFKLGASHQAAAPITRVRCSRMWADIAANIEDWDEAVRAWGETLDLLPMLVDRSLTRRDRQHHLSLWDGFGPQAAAAAIRTGNLDLAWQTLELGRGVLLRQALASRVDEKLHYRHPELAAQFEHLRALLITEATADRRGAPATDPPAQRRQTARKWEELLVTIRSKEGFERFGLPPTIDELSQATADGVVVAVCVTRHGCDALLLNGDGPSWLALPELIHTEAIDRANAFLAAVNNAPTAGASMVATDVLKWLWDTAAGPVLDHLGYRSTPTETAPWPRVWWIPTGPLSVLPLHAAGHHDDPRGQGRRTVLDRVVSSYTPTVLMLRQASRHTRSPEPRATQATIVGINTIEGHRPLTSAVSEATWVNEVLQSERPPLIDAGATVSAVRSGLHQAKWAHFSCHADAADDPADSHLLLADGAMAAHELSNLDLSEAWLAYLSACTTAYGGTNLLDESIHIASAFQIAGFPHVIATLWQISDAVALRFAKHVYSQLLSDVSPALAVHQAVHAMRKRYPEHPHSWASHVHFGP